MVSSIVGKIVFPEKMTLESLRVAIFMFGWQYLRYCWEISNAAPVNGSTSKTASNDANKNSLFLN